MYIFRRECSVCIYAWTPEKGGARRQQNSLFFINKFNTTHGELARSANWELTPCPNWRPFLHIVSTQLLATLTDEWGNHSPARLSFPPRLSVYTTWLQTRVLFLPPSEHLQSLLLLVHWLHLYLRHRSFLGILSFNHHLEDTWQAFPVCWVVCEIILQLSWVISKKRKGVGLCLLE